VVWEDRIFLTASVAIGTPGQPVYDNAPGSHDNLPVTQRHSFVVCALSRKDGRLLWQRRVHEEFPHEGGHTTGSLASNSPVTDGEFVFAFFGSRGVYAFALDGEPKWEKRLGVMQTLHAHGEGSSPALFGDTLVVNWDHEGDSFVRALDRRTGRERWTIARDEKTSWSTPLIVDHGGKPLVVISATKRVRAYDLETGKLQWDCGGLSRNVVSSPVAGGGMVFAGSSYDVQAMVAVRLDEARGDLDGTDRIAWRLDRLTPYVPSPLLHEGRLYFLRHNQNLLSRLDAATGRALGEPLRLAGLRDIFASPAAAGGRIYIASRDGLTAVVRHGEPFEVLAMNKLDERFSASPALVGREVFLRGERFLYCLAENPIPGP
jgi:outer membrane protein assembly factor BamB